jgi:hypothetical protein
LTRAGTILTRRSRAGGDDPGVTLVWIAVGAVYALTLGAGIGLQYVLESRHPGAARLVQFTYLWVPLGTAMVVAVLMLGARS